MTKPFGQNPFLVQNEREFDTASPGDKFFSTYTDYATLQNKTKKNLLIVDSKGADGKVQ